MVLIDRIKGLSLKTKIILSSVIVVVIAAVVIICLLMNKGGYTATTMRLLRVEGTVNIEDGNGKQKPVIDNIRFQSGDALNTGADGLASVGLDDTKIVTLQNDSRAEFKKKNKKLELKLTKGGLYFEVTEKLSDDESFEISTTTMTVGIRGTSGYVFCDEQGRPSVIITDGKVHIVAKNPDTGEVKETDCEAGHKVTVYTFNDRPKDTVDFKEEEIEVDELNEFTLSMLAENEDLLNKVCADTGWSKEEILALAKDPNAFIKETDPSESGDDPTDPGETSEPSDSSKPESSEPSDQDPSGTSEPGETTKPKKKPTPTPTPKPSDSSSDPSQSESSEPSESESSESSEPSKPESSEPSQSESSEPSKSESSEPSKSESSEPSKSESSESESKETEPGETEEPSDGPEIPEDGENDRYSKEYWDPEGNGEIYILRHTISSGDGALEFEYLGYINEDWIHLDRVENDVGGFDLVYLEEDDPIVYYSIPG